MKRRDFLKWLGLGATAVLPGAELLAPVPWKGCEEPDTVKIPPKEPAKRLRVCPANCPCRQNPQKWILAHYRF